MTQAALLTVILEKLLFSLHV